MRWLCVSVIAAVLVLPAAAVQAQKYQQKYSAWTFVEEKNDKGGYHQCEYTAVDGAGKTVNRQLVFYYPNNPRGGNTDRSNYWVYWYNLDKQTIWGRCPTPKHPQYKQMQQQAKGKDLWQLIPPKKQQPNVMLVHKVAANFGNTLSTEKEHLPKVKMGEDATITCVDFTNAIFN